MNTDDTRSVELIGVFAPGQRYSAESESSGVVIRDDQLRAVATLPFAPGGEASGRRWRWTVAAERERARWLVVARDPATDEPAGCGYPRRLPGTYDLWVAPDSTYRLRDNPMTGTWTLRKGRDRLARFRSGTPQTIEIPGFSTTVGAG